MWLVTIKSCRYCLLCIFWSYCLSKRTKRHFKSSVELIWTENSNKIHVNNNNNDIILGKFFATTYFVNSLKIFYLPCSNVKISHTFPLLEWILELPWLPNAAVVKTALNPYFLVSIRFLNFRKCSLPRTSGMILCRTTELPCKIVFFFNLFSLVGKRSTDSLDVLQI